MFFFPSSVPLKTSPVLKVFSVMPTIPPMVTVAEYSEVNSKFPVKLVFCSELQEIIPKLKVKKQIIFFMAIFFIRCLIPKEVALNSEDLSAPILEI